MGQCSTTPGECSSVRHQQINLQDPEDTQMYAEASEMVEGSQEIDFNSFMEANNTAVTIAKEKYHRFDKLSNDYCELKSLNERLMQENESLRQRYVENNFV